MSDFTAVRIGQLPEEIWRGTDNLPHEVGTELKRGTVADLATYIAGIIDSSAGLAFNPLSISDGQTLPETTVNEWIIVGQGAYLQTGGFADVVCTDDINIVISNGVSWSLGFGIAVDGVDTSQFVKLTTNQTIDGVKTFAQPITFGNSSTVQEGNIGGISLVCSIAKELNWQEGVLRSYNQSDANSKANPIISESPITYVGQEFANLINFSNPDPITSVVSIQFEGDLRSMNTAFNYENIDYRLYLYDLDNNILGIGKYDGVVYNDVDLSTLDVYDVEYIKPNSTINAIVKVVGREYNSNTLPTIEEVERRFIPLSGTEVGKPITGDLEFSEPFGIKYKGGNYPDNFSGLAGGEGGVELYNRNIITNIYTALIVGQAGFSIITNSNNSRGLLGSKDFSPNITDLDYTQKIYVDNGLSTKLDASLYNDRYKGKFTSLVNLQTALPTANAGDYAQVDAGAGALVRNYNYDLEDGWVIGGAGSGATSTDALIEGSTNLYFTTARVLATLLSGLSVATGGAIVSTDSVLSAFGKLQKQITDNLAQLQWTRTGNDITNNTPFGNVNVRLGGDNNSWLNVRNASNNVTARIKDSGIFETMVNGGGLVNLDGGASVTFSNRVIRFYNNLAGNEQTSMYQFNPINLDRKTSGILDIIGFSNQTVNPQSGNAIFNFLNLSPTIIQTGGANGITRGIYVNPTLTSAADFRALEITAGKVIIPNATASNEAVNKGQLDLKANIANPTFTGSVQVPSIQRTNGSGFFKVEDSGIEWHTTRWFTPTGTFSSSGVNVTTTGGQLTASMVGSKIGVGTDKRIITTFLTSNTCTVDSAFSTNYVNEPLANWGVFSRSEFYNGTFKTFFSETGATIFRTSAGGSVQFFNGIEIFNNAGFFLTEFVCQNNYTFRFSSTSNPFGTKDVGFRRNSAGVLEIFDGVTNGNFRDIRVRNVIATTPTYATDAAADADSTLPSGAFYKLTGSRAVFQKP